MSEGAQALGRQISGAGDLQSVVGAMKALAASNIERFEAAVRSLADYNRTVELGLSICLRRRPSEPPVLTQKAAPVTIQVVVFGSDQGLVGQFNEDLVDFAVASLKGQGDQDPKTDRRQIWAMGDRMGRRLADVNQSPIDTLPMPNSIRGITALVEHLQIELASHRKEAQMPVYVLHNRPRTEGGYEPVIQKMLPLDAEWQADLANLPWPTVQIPEIMDEVDTLSALLREYLFLSLFKACAESMASENASRLAAMERADKNITDLLETLTNKYRRLRQSAIDEELFDIVAGAEALPA